MFRNVALETYQGDIFKQFSGFPDCGKWTEQLVSDTAAAFCFTVAPPCISRSNHGHTTFWAADEEPTFFWWKQNPKLQSQISRSQGFILFLKIWDSFKRWNTTTNIFTEGRNEIRLLEYWVKVCLPVRVWDSGKKSDLFEVHAATDTHTHTHFHRRGASLSLKGQDTPVSTSPPPHTHWNKESTQCNTQ